MLAILTENIGKLIYECQDIHSEITYYLVDSNEHDLKVMTLRDSVVTKPLEQHFALITMGTSLYNGGKSRAEIIEFLGGAEYLKFETEIFNNAYEEIDKMIKSDTQ
jgi:hypothetical protein